MRMLRIITTIVLLAGSIGFGPYRALAQPQPSPDALQAANELFSILSKDMLGQLMSQMTNALWPTLERQARANNINDATLADMRTEFDRIQLDNLTEMMKEAPPIYARHFSADELHQLAD